MKKILTFILAAIMLVSATVVYTGAAGTLVFEDTFEKGFAPRNWITNSNSCAFSYDKENQCIIGYDNARVLQSEYNNKYDKKWAQFYTSFDFQIRGFDDLPEEEGRTHGIGMWYRDLMQNSIDETGEQEGAVYMFKIEIESGKAELTKEHSWSYKDANGITQQTSTSVVIAEGQLPVTIEVAEDAPYYEIGMRVTSGKIECYFEQQVIISAEVDPEDTLYGAFTKNSVDASVGSQKSAILFWNEGNYIALDNFQVWTPDYDFVAVTVVYGDVTGEGSVNLSDVSKLLQYVAKWEGVEVNTVAADVNCDNSINLSDVTKVLQFIAGWEGVVLGPTA